MAVQYIRASIADYDDVIDLGNYVFSAAHVPHDFPRLLPKQYRREYFMEGIHYLAREDGRIKAVVGAYPLTLNILGEKLSGRGVGMVGVHPYARSRGYMKVLMGMLLEDLRKDGLVFSCLSGQRQRYEYFGYAPAGTRVIFKCQADNVRHTLGKDFSPGFSLRQVTAEDREILDGIAAFHESKIARIERPRGKLFPILLSWKSSIYALMEGGALAGYIVKKGGDNEISEINLKDPSRMAEAIGLFLNRPEAAGNRVDVSVQPHETAKLEALSRFAENCLVTSACSFNVLDWPRFLAPLLDLRAQITALSAGSTVFKIGDGESLRVAVTGGRPSLVPVGTAPDISLNPLEAVGFFFSPMTPATTPSIRENPFLRSLLPLPLFFEGADAV
ncbi:MAG: GNAT family N-acetyltransferase [Treponema sp.]|jgi:predicted N-acetyltransferase YhbS|nr:GNAT family N-acetyltransferase [Treponema sp.]